jgi:hypothetical protein
MDRAGAKVSESAEIRKRAASLISIEAGCYSIRTRTCYVCFESKAAARH